MCGHFALFASGGCLNVRTWCDVLVIQERLKEIINDHLRSSNVYGKVRSFVRDFLATEEGVALEEDKLLTSLHEKKVVEDLIASMGQEHDRPLSRSLAGLKVSSGSAPLVPAKGEKFLHVKVERGAAFTDSLVDGSRSVPCVHAIRFSVCLFSDIRMILVWQGACR